MPALFYFIFPLTVSIYVFLDFTFSALMVLVEPKALHMVITCFEKSIKDTLLIAEFE